MEEVQGTLASLTVIVLSYNRKDELINNLPQLCEASKKTGYELIVVDNASTDGSREVLAELKEKFLSLQVLLNSENLGVAMGRNVGWRAATRDYILNIDDDTRLDEIEIVAMYQAILARPGVGIISPRVVHAISGQPQSDHGAEDYQLANFMGGCHLLKTEVYKKVGEIDPFCSFGGEELDYSIRVRAAGYTILYIPHVTVRHNGLVRTGAESIWRRRQWLYNFSRVHFKHFPIGMACLLSFRYCLSHVLSGVRQHGWFLAFSLPKQVVQGALDGKRQYHPVPQAVKMFYADANLKPDFGNIPLYRKFKGVVVRSFNRVCGLDAAIGGCPRCDR